MYLPVLFLVVEVVFVLGAVEVVLVLGRVDVVVGQLSVNLKEIYLEQSYIKTIGDFKYP